MSSEERPSPPQSNPPPTSNRFRFTFMHGLFLVWAVWMVVTLLDGSTGRSIPYSEFKDHLANGDIQSCAVSEDSINGMMKIVEEGEEKEVAFETVRVEDPDLIKELEAAEIDYTGRKASPYGVLLMWLLPLGLLFLLWFFMLRAANPGARAMTFGKSKARIVAENAIDVSFNDVAGCDESKEELREIVQFLRTPEHFTGLGAKIPKGVLLVGPPGTGKTLLARAVAGEASVPFFSISGSEFVEMFVGVGAARVRDLFEQAKARAPCLVFVDELDAIGRQRGVQFGAVNDEREQTLNQLLVEMDGFEANSGVILLAATNRPDVLDKALLRPGRFDRQVVLDTPDLSGREAILVVHTVGKPMAKAVDLHRIAQSTPGFTGADLANAVNEAALLAARRRHVEISQEDLEDAVEKVVAGPERRSRRLSSEAKRRVAFHEVGHALVAIHSEFADPVQKISIVPRGQAALGYTLQTPEEDQFLLTHGELIARLRGLVGGRAAEEIEFAEVSTGAQNDLERATALVRQMVCVHGMSSKIGLLHCARRDAPMFLRGDTASWVKDCSEETAHVIDEEVTRLLDEAYQAAKEILQQHRGELDAVAHELLRKETLDRHEIDEILGEVRGVAPHLSLQPFEVTPGD